MERRNLSAQRGDYNIQCPIVSSTVPLIPCRRYPNPFLFERERTTAYLGCTPRRPLRSSPGIYPDPPEHGVNGLINPSTRPVTESKQNEIGTKQAIITLACIFSFSLLALLYVYNNFPDLEEDEKIHVKMPWDIEDAKKLGKVLDRYKDRYYFEVLSGIFVAYIFLQTFAIPGSISLSILSGFLFPFPVALLLICFCSATGASLCYMLSYFVGRRIIYKYFAERATKWAHSVNKHRHNLIYYIVFLRVTPFLPNWFINLAAPIINVPLFPFWLGTFVGVGPPSFVAIQAGQMLYSLSSSSDAWSWMSIMLLAVFAILSLVPVLLQHRLRDKFE